MALASRLFLIVVLMAASWLSAAAHEIAFERTLSQETVLSSAVPCHFGEVGNVSFERKAGGYTGKTIQAQSDHRYDPVFDACLLVCQISQSVLPVVGAAGPTLNAATILWPHREASPADLSVAPPVEPPKPLT